MNILQINANNFGSTGNIAYEIGVKSINEGFHMTFAYPKSKSNMRKHINFGKYIGNRIDRNLHLILSYFTGLNGCFSYFTTKTFINSLQQKPDIIHIHNLHNCYINLRLLFNYIKMNNIGVVWTLHDCWSFTGRCTNCVSINCDKWKIGCNQCIYNKKRYPSTLIDSSSVMWKLKKDWFTNVKRLRIITPSNWLANLVSESFLKDYPINIINNGINQKIFYPRKSYFREKIKIFKQYIILGVSFGWSKSKGVDIFNELSRQLDQKKYKIVLVGTDDVVDSILEKNIISIHRTQNQNELAEIYSGADVFVNPTREDNFPTVNIEAISCGTPVITYNTGGSPEIIDKHCGVVINSNDINALKNEIIRVCETHIFNKEDCLTRAQKFNMDYCNNEYINVYKELMNE